MVNRWRCLNGRCKTDTFAADVPLCPTCGADGRNPRYAPYIVPVETIHFDAPDPIVDNLGVGYLACDPTRPIAGSRASGTHEAVNCEACQATEAFRASFPRITGVLPPEAVAPLVTIDGDTIKRVDSGCC